MKLDKDLNGVISISPYLDRHYKNMSVNSIWMPPIFSDFDEKLSFDFYTEAFQIDAYEQHGILTSVLPVRLHHYSFGNMNNARFFMQLRYLWDKYKADKRVYRTTTYRFLGPHKDVVRVLSNIRSRRRAVLARKVLSFFWMKKFSPDGYLRIKVFGIRIKLRYADMDSWRRCDKGLSVI
jgi:hypothetical protein